MTRLPLMILCLLLLSTLFAADMPPGPPLFARVTILEARDTAGPFDATLTIPVIHRNPWYPGYKYSASRLTLNAPSEWMELTDIYPGNNVVTASLSLTAAGRPVKGLVRARVELARAKDAPPLAALEIADPLGTLGMVLPERAVKDAEIPARFQSIAQIARRHLEASQACAVSPEDRPKHFIATARASLFGAYTDPAIAETEVQSLANLGYNTMTNLSAEWANKFNVPYVGGADYRPPGIDGKPVTAEEIFKHYQGTAEGVKKDYGSIDRLRIFAMSDEPNWDFPPTSAALNKDPEALKRFCDYLKANGMTPELLGKTSWDDVRFAVPPAADTPLGDRRAWYYTVRFAGLDQARRYGEATVQLRKAMGDRVLAYTNWNNPGIMASDCLRWHGNPFTSSHDWFDFSRAKGSTCLWLGPGISEDRDASTFRTWSLMLDLLRSAAKEGVGKFGAYLHHNFIPDDRGFEVALSIMAIAGRGGSGYDSYVWGPHYAFTEYMWSEKLGHYQYAADANRLVGRSEALMHGARGPQAEVAILWPITSQIYDLNKLGYWRYNRDFLVETQQIYFALSHNNIPVDFVDETMIQRGSLLKYKVLYVAEPNLQRKTVGSIDAWVRSGGRLFASAPAGMKDEFNQPTPVMESLLGIKFRSISRSAVNYAPKGGLRYLDALGKVTLEKNAELGDASFEAVGSRTSFVLAGGEVAGRFDDGRPAVVRNRPGKGEVLYFATMPGLAYSRGANERPNEPTIDYPKPIGQLITALPESLGIAKPVTTSQPYVEALRLDSDKGIAVTLLNWSTKPLDSLEVTISGDLAGTTVRSARGTQLTAAPAADGKTIQVTVPMPEVVDVLLVEFQQ
ncbi:MAG: beta-galactosidase trimerization domain-containing protein [Armatimonadota bacterium]